MRRYVDGHGHVWLLPDIDGGEVDYVHDPDDTDRPGTDTYTDNARGGY